MCIICKKELGSLEHVLKKCDIGAMYTGGIGEDRSDKLSRIMYVNGDSEIVRIFKALNKIGYEFGLCMIKKV